MGVKRPWENILLAFASKTIGVCWENILVAFASKTIGVWKSSWICALERGGSPTGEVRACIFAWTS